MLPPPSLREYAIHTDRLRSRLRPLAPERPADAVLVTVVTVVLNGARTIAACLDSVQAQTYPWIEHLVIDGGSTDGTIAILEQRADTLAGWVSEPDGGISDAFNKGLALARGTVIGILNADDRYLPHSASAALAALAANPSAAWTFGDCDFLLDGHVVLHRNGDPQYARTIARRMPVVNHPTVFVRHAAYAQAGLFRTDLRLAMDYDLLLRFHRAGLHGVHVPHTQAQMALGGITGQHIFRAYGESATIAVAHGRPRALAALDFLANCAPAFVRFIARSFGLRAAWRALRLRRRT